MRFHPMTAAHFNQPHYKYCWWISCRTFLKFIYIMMRGEYYSPPPTPPKPMEKIRRKRAAPKSAAPMADILPPEDYGAGSDTLGLSTGPKKEESDEDKQCVFVMFVYILLIRLLLLFHFRTVVSGRNMLTAPRSHFWSLLILSFSLCSLSLKLSDGIRSICFTLKMWPFFA